MSTGVVAERVEAFLTQARNGAGRQGVRLALDALDAGVPCEEVIVGLLGAAQHESGERWQRNEWTVADEHLATGVTQKALDAVAGTLEPTAHKGFVIVACAEGDWHSLPAQMFAELLSADGFAVSFLGASTPAAHVDSLISRSRPDAVAVSCNLPIFFGGVTRLANVAHRHGVPVIAGGRALGHDSRYALRLGVDAWGAGVVDASPILNAWRCDRPAVAAADTELHPGSAQLDSDAEAIAGEAFELLSTAYPMIKSYNEQQLARTREDLAFIVRFIAAARLVDDPIVLTDFLTWLTSLLAVRGVPLAAVGAGLAVLAPLVGRIDSAAGQLARDALTTLPS
jgi:methanogenic corrinoid protein MtbC1